MRLGFKIFVWSGFVCGRKFYFDAVGGAGMIDIYAWSAGAVYKFDP